MIIFLIVLVGLPGCGKSTFSANLRERLGPLGIKVDIINQDTLGKPRCLKSCDAFIKDGLAMAEAEAGKMVIVIDRTNISPEQRALWLDIARKYPLDRIRLICAFFDVSAEVCKQRAMERVAHPTLPPSKVPGVIARMQREFRPPTLDEGFEQILIVSSGQELVGQVAAMVLE